MAHLEMDQLCEAFAAPRPSPAGGSAAAAVAAIAASLVVMVGRGSPEWEQGAEVAASASALRDRLLDLGTEDVEAVTALLAALRVPSQPEAEDTTARDGAFRLASEVPREIGECAARVAELGRSAAASGKPAMRADAEAAAALALAAVQVTSSIVEANAAVSMAGRIAPRDGVV